MKTLQLIDDSFDSVAAAAPTQPMCFQAALFLNLHQAASNKLPVSTTQVLAVATSAAAAGLRAQFRWRRRKVQLGTFMFSRWIRGARTTLTAADGRCLFTADDKEGEISAQLAASQSNVSVSSCLVGAGCGGCPRRAASVAWPSTNQSPSHSLRLCASKLCAGRLQHQRRQQQQQQQQQPL